MDRHLPGAEVGDRRAREWREQGFASEEDMLDWLENRKRVPPGPGNATRGFWKALGLAIAGAVAAISRFKSR